MQMWLPKKTKIFSNQQAGLSVNNEIIYFLLRPISGSADAPTVPLGETCRAIWFDLALLGVL
jgi:hypothetical protein